MLHRSAQVALRQARANIDAVRNARGSKSKIIKHYRAAKNALDNVDALTMNIPDLKDMIAVLQDLAVVLDHSGDQEKSAKCRQRAAALR